MSNINNEFVPPQLQRQNGFQMKTAAVSSRQPQSAAEDLDEEDIALAEIIHSIQEEDEQEIKIIKIINKNKK